LFVPLTAEKTGIEFTNSLQYTEHLNPYTFKNFYNGGGVAIGDVNNDGLADIFFCGNMVSNRLYLNRGNLKFQDITVAAGLESNNQWTTGVSLVDINADGFLDIYLCKSGPPGGERRHNQLFISTPTPDTPHEGGPRRVPPPSRGVGGVTFTEQAEQYGLDNIGLSVHAVFFDYDKDGDLDCYLLNNSITSIGSFQVVKDQRLIPDSLGGNKLLRNDNGYFNNVTVESGIYSSKIGFGLGATVGDINHDNWPDIYISNDFFEKDYLYINQQDGTFTDQLEDYVKEISMGSMGADLADINNDGHPEYFVTEMLPEKRARQVTKTFFESWDEQKNARSKGYFNQFGRNVLQLNNGNGTFSEIGRYAGVDATDWSWSSLIFDMDNDGLKDIFVSNGIYKDLLDLDYLKFMNDPSNVRNIIQSKENAISSMIDMMPSEPIPNYAFQNNGDLTFTNKAAQWGMQQPTFSNGSAYGDLDNDGDLDLVVNNVNMASTIYENKARQVNQNRNYLALKLIGMGANTFAIGAKVRIFIDDKILYQELNPARGFESTVDHKLVFGLDTPDRIDSVKVTWPGGRKTTLVDVRVNQLIELKEIDAEPTATSVEKSSPPLFSPYENESLDFIHVENDFVDFNRDRLLFHMNSTEGPCICKGDINNDGLDDLYIGGASGQAGSLLVQTRSGAFLSIGENFKKDEAQGEDLDCAFFDANNDGNQDLYVTSGGSEFSSFSVWLNDRLYFGQGNGRFTRSDQNLPFKGLESTSTVMPVDYDSDGDQDLFIGGRQVPFYYGVPADSYMLENNGNGEYTRVVHQSYNILNKLGMVTDAVTTDLDGDGSQELVVVGQWMPVRIFKINDGVIRDVSNQWGLERSHGWYHTVEAEDLNGDGSVDLLVGNHGLNTRFKATIEEPIELLVNDFDNNGTFEQIISMYYEGKQYPFVQLKELAMQLPSVGQLYSSFSDYQEIETDILFSEETQSKGYVLETFNLASGIFFNKAGKFSFEKLPARAQLAPVYAFKTGDFDGDGNIDLVVGGNFSESKPEVGTYMASYGAFFRGQGNGKFSFVPSHESGLNIEGNVRGIEEVKIGDRKVLIFTRNNNKIYATEYDVE